MKPRMLLVVGWLLGLVGAAVAPPADTEEKVIKVDEGSSKAIPWSGYWWPMQDRSIITPLCKYDQITGNRAAIWETAYHCVAASASEKEVESWWGYCHGWSASAVMEKEPVRAVTHEGFAGEQVELSVGELKALLAAAHTGDISLTYGKRFKEGMSEEDKQDLPPDALWYLLKLFVQRQRVPLVLDLDAGPQVWNHPVFAYRVEHVRLNDEGEHVARMALLLTDSNVEPDFVGVQAVLQTYYFRFRMQEDRVVMGSGKWMGPSVEDHPDFAWYPVVPFSQNPYVRYRSVRKLVDPAIEATKPPAEPDSPEPQNGHDGPQNGTDHPSPFAPSRAAFVSPIELAALIASKSSAFKLQVAVDRAAGTVGERFRIHGSSEKEGYLYLLHIDPKGELRLLFPQARQDNQVAARKPFEVGGAKNQPLLVSGPAGLHRIKALITSQPLRLTGLSQRPPQGDRPGQAQEFRWHPTQRQQMQRFMQLHLQHRLKLEDLGNLQMEKLLGQFAQGEVSLEVQSGGAD